MMMPGHTFVYSPSVNAVRDLIQDDELGEIYFITSSRMNLGLYQQDGVVLDLAPHDLSILLHWLDRPLLEVSATGRSVFQEGVHETAFLTLRFEGGTQANVQLSWLAPRKMRQMVVVGSRRMVQYEDTAADDSVRIYDRGLDFAEPPANFGEYRLTYRTGDMVAPARPGPGAARPGAERLRLRDPRGHDAGLQRPPRASRSCSASRRWRSRCRTSGKPVAVRSVAEAMRRRPRRPAGARSAAATSGRRPPGPQRVWRGTTPRKSSSAR